MAIGRLSMKVGAKGKATPHAAYIARTGKYQHRLETSERLVATGTGNMPGWAQTDPSSFWKAADTFERENGTTYREMEIALPRELNDDQKQRLIQEWVKQEIGTRHAYQWAIHSPRASDGGEQPHAHLMFSERTMDGIEREPGQLFKRYNSKTPEKGGAKKANTGKHPLERKEELKALRHRWEVLCNRHLRAAECRERVSLKPNNEIRQGEPEPKILPSEWQRGTGKADIIAFREARKEKVDARHDVRLSVRPTEQMEAELIHLAYWKKVDQEKSRQEVATRRAGEERQALIAKLPAMEKAVIAEIEDETNRRLRMDGEFQALQREREQHEKAHQEAEANAEKAEHDEAAAAQEAQNLAKKHTIQTRLHRYGFKTFMPLAEAEQFRDDCKTYKEAERTRQTSLAEKVQQIDQKLKEIRQRILDKARKDLDGLYKKFTSIREAMKVVKEVHAAQEKAQKKANQAEQAVRKRGRGR